jgi:glutathione synthase/RimK-type ligase-like ATP-grasp enzyme
MVITPDDDYIFIEINPNGQWLWIEQLTGMPISKSILNLLV